MFTRIAGYTPLSRVGDAWEKLDNVLDITPDCDPRTLSRVLTTVGEDRVAQQAVFQHLASPARQLVYDLSFVFSYSETVNLVGVRLQRRRGLAAAGQHRALQRDRYRTPGDDLGSAWFGSGCRHPGPVTAGDRYHLDNPRPRPGFVLEANKTLLREARIPFVLPQRRNSTWYETQIHLIDHFFYHKQLIRAGRTLIASAMTAEPREVYDLYKSRNLIEDHFVAFRGLIQADNRYLRDATAVFGHVFVGFLCLYLYCRILNRIKQAGMTAHLSPQGLLLKLSKVYAVENEGEGRPPRCPNRSRRSRRNSNSIIP
jgi:hypothetical protein